MHRRIASTKSMSSAWELISRLRKACVFQDFVVVLRAPDAPPEVYAATAIHPVDQTMAREAVRVMATEAR
jgi:hypothetical protein